MASSVEVMRALAIAAAVAGMTELGCGLNGAGDGTPTDAGVLATGDDAGSFGLGNPTGATACDDGGTHPPPRLPYPAFTPASGKLLDHGGDILKSPRIVTVTWSADPNEAKLQAFDDALGASGYWKEAMGPYGVGPSKSDASLHVSLKTAPPATMKDTDIVPFLVSQITAAGSHWPQPDPETVYTLYVPESVSVTSGGSDACNNALGDHGEMKVGSIPLVAWAYALEQCHDAMTSALDTATSTQIHELTEAATDPYPYSSVAWGGFETHLLAWELWQTGAADLFDIANDEVADGCEYYLDAYYTEGPDLPFAVSRIWSNASARAGHNPCIPVPVGTAYFSVAPLGLETIDAAVGTFKGPTSGWRVPPGTSRTVQIGFYSDAATSPWELRAVEGDVMSGAMTAPLLGLVLDKNKGQNGTIANLTITVTSAPASGNVVLMTLLSSQYGVPHYVPVLIGAY